MLELKGDGGTHAYGSGHSLYAGTGMHVRRALPRMQQVSGQGIPLFFGSCLPYRVKDTLELLRVCRIPPSYDRNSLQVSIREKHILRPIIRAASGLLLGLCAAQALAITLTPNAIGGGNIPGTYPTVDFQTWDGNWAPVLRLPASAAGGASITFHPNATWSSSLATDNTDLPMRALTLNKGDTITFTWDAWERRWLAAATDYKDLRTVTIVPSPTTRVTRVSIDRKDMVESVVLPPTATPNAIVIVQSTSSRPGRVDSANVLHPTPMPLGMNVRYAFVFHPQLQKWYLAE